MKKALVRQLFIVAMSLGGAFAVGLSAQRSAGAPQKDGGIALQRPAFLEVAHADTGQISNFAEDEAGIAAYINLNQVVTLNVVDDVCRTVEASTVDYFQCSVGLPDYDESHDVKVYVAKSGWILAYYPRGIPTSRIFDWRHYDGGSAISTKLENAINLVIAKAGSSASGPSFYHFAYPNANKLLLIADKAAKNTIDSFQVNLPDAVGFQYFERTFSVADEPQCCSNGGVLTLDSQAISTFNSWSNFWRYLEGSLTATQLSTATQHEFSITSPNGGASFGGLALIYKVP